jgi:hypothetical protein
MRVARDAHPYSIASSALLLAAGLRAGVEVLRLGDQRFAAGRT